VLFNLFEISKIIKKDRTKLNEIIKLMTISKYLLFKKKIEKKIIENGSNIFKIETKKNKFFVNILLNKIAIKVLNSIIFAWKNGI
tara:strand:- start:812 stop:1066 length:255 start_codon:yes stop_codon:yes gene_type:complete